jgi:hypothetical protein
MRLDLKTTERILWEKPCPDFIAIPKHRQLPRRVIRPILAKLWG